MMYCRLAIARLYDNSDEVAYAPSSESSYKIDASFQYGLNVPEPHKMCIIEHVYYL